MLSFTLFMVLSAAPARANPTAVVVDGGGDATSNYCRYYKNIERTEKLFSSWDRSNFVAGGPSQPGVNMTSCDAKGEINYAVDGTPILERRAPAGTWDGGANFADLEKRVKSVKPGEPVMMYFTDHGSLGNGPRDRTVVLWGQTLSVDQLRTLINEVPPENKVVLVNDQCFGGGMLDSLFEPGNIKTKRPHACGFASATAAEFSYNGGGFMEMAEKMFDSKDPKVAKAADVGHDGQYSFGDVQRYMRRSYSTLSTPISSSDLYLQKYVEPAYFGSSGLVGQQSSILGDCLFTDKGFKEVTAGLSPTLEALLQTRLNQLKSDLGAEYKGAGMSPNSSFEAILKDRDKREGEVKKLEEDFDGVRADMRSAFAHWLRDKGDPALFQRMEDHRKKLFDTQLKLTTGPSAAEKAKLEADAARLSEEIGRDEVEAQKYNSAVHAQNGNAQIKSFNEYTKSKGGHPPDDGYPTNILDKFTTQIETMATKNQQLQSYRRLYNSVAGYNALKSMITAKDTSSMSQYLDLLDCENTPIGPVPQAQKGG